MFDLYMVFEFVTGGSMSIAVIMEPSDGQAYRVTSLHKVTHYQLQGRENVETYMNSVGLERVQSSEVVAGQEGYVVLLNADANHSIPNVIEVCNGIVKSDDYYLVDLLKRMRMDDLASRSYSGNQLKTGGARGNARIDIGFAAQSHNDKTVVIGMNAPKFTTWADSVMGVSKEESLTVSMMKAGILLSYIIAYVFEDRYSDDFQQDAERNSLFSNHQAKIRGVENWADYTYEGSSLGINGLLPSGRVMILHPHLDALNSRVEGYNVYHGVSICYQVRYNNMPGRHWIRVSFGGYGKKCVDDFMIRYQRNTRLCTRVMGWMEANPEVQMDGTEILINHDNPMQFDLIRARADKSVYFSIYVYVLLIIGNATGFDLAIMLEAVFCSSISNSPRRFYEESMHALDAIRDGDTTNFIELFIESCMKNHGSVTGGVGVRHAPSSGGGMEKSMLYQSLVNLKNLCNNESPLVKWISRTTEGGLQGVGPLIGQELMQILTLVGAISDVSLIENVIVSRTTHTHRRLSDYENIRTERHQQELVAYMANRMGVAPSYVENALCEYCRDHYGRDIGNDTIVKGQSLYRLTPGGKLRVVSLGKEDVIDRPEWNFDTGFYTPTIAWWDEGFKCELLGDYYICFSNRKRKDHTQS